VRIRYMNASVSFLGVTARYESVQEKCPFYFPGG
jgi:hypothetical protein